MDRLPQLGLVCITASEVVRFKTITRKRMLQFPPEAQTQILRDLYGGNAIRLSAAVQFCQDNAIGLYRLSSNLFPFADDAIGEDVLSEFAENLAQIGRQAEKAGVRLVLHPDQFVVLNSEKPDVIANSIKILTMHARIFDYLGLPHSPWALMNIHGGKGGRGEQLIETIRALPDGIRCRLTLENDEYTYSSKDMVDICRAAGIAMVFDAHHHVVHEKLDTYEDDSVFEAVAGARSTWENPDWQLVHISNGENSFRDARHSDYIYEMPNAFRQVQWIEIEAKQKEKAIARLKEELKEKWLTPAAASV